MTERDIQVIIEKRLIRAIVLEVLNIEKQERCPEDGGFLTSDGNCNHPNHEGGSGGYSPEVQELLGKEHTGVKGIAAIEKLLEEKSGHVKSALSRKGIGPIDLIWGNDDIGLHHIIKRRDEQGFDGESFLYEIPNVIRQGNVRERPDGRIEIRHGDISAIVSSNLKGYDIQFLLTAFYLD